MEDQNAKKKNLGLGIANCSELSLEESEGEDEVVEGKKVSKGHRAIDFAMHI